MWRTVRLVFIHLRLNWQVILLPIFLWGFLLSGGEVTHRFWLGLVVFHVLFYGGSTAYNSYYDQDEGPVGGLWAPPKAGREVLVAALAIQVAGLVLVAWFIGLPLLLVCLVMGAFSTGYSHPAVRFKGRPWASLLTVSLGQGVGGAMGGWLCGQPDPATMLSPTAALGFVTSALITTGFYPLSQVYQRAEDRRRGDVTFAVRFGERAFPFAIACMLAGAATGGAVLWRLYGPGHAALLAAGLLLFSGLILRWWRRFDEAQLRRNFSQVMRLGYLLSLSFVVYIGWHLLR